jgi:hypothetical protein
MTNYLDEWINMYGRNKQLLERGSYLGAIYR